MLACERIFPDLPVFAAAEKQARANMTAEYAAMTDQSMD